MGLSGRITEHAAHAHPAAWLDAPTGEGWWWIACGAEVLPAEVSKTEGRDDPTEQWVVRFFGDRPVYGPTIEETAARTDHAHTKHRWCRFIEEPPKP